MINSKGSKRLQAGGRQGRNTPPCPEYGKTALDSNSVSLHQHVQNRALGLTRYRDHLKRLGQHDGKIFFWPYVEFVDS